MPVKIDNELGILGRPN